jgi:Thioredoxin-like domain
VVPLHLLRHTGAIEKINPAVFSMKRSLPCILVCAVALSSCAKLGLGGKAQKKDVPSPFGATGIPPQLRKKSPEPGIAVVAGGNTTPTTPSKPVLNLTPQEDIVYTNPDDPDASLPELGELLSQAKRGPWEQSETIAKQRSAREGKPLLIWFTDSESSPMCKALYQELFSTNEFGNWATEKLIRLKVDAYVKITDPDMDLGTAEDRRVLVMTYNAEIKKRYKILGFPALVMVSPNGEVVGRYRGYKRGGAEYLWGQMKHAEAVSAEATRGWRKGLEGKGYREWRDRKERKVFAKLISYSKGTLNLIEPDGTRSRTTEDKLGDEDRKWIAEQKRIRNLQ